MLLVLSVISFVHIKEDALKNKMISNIDFITLFLLNSSIFKKTKVWSGKAGLLVASVINIRVLWAKVVAFWLKEKCCCKDRPITEISERNWTFNGNETSTNASYTHSWRFTFLPEFFTILIGSLLPF